MNAFSKRYFVWIALIYLGFSCFSLAFEGWKIFAVFSVFLLILGMALRKFNLKSKNLTVVCILMAIASLISCARAQMMLFNNSAKIDEYSGEHYVSGYISRVEANTNYFSEYVLHVEEVDGESAALDLIVVSDYKSDLTRGDFILLCVEISPLEDSKYFSYMTNNNA